MELAPEVIAALVRRRRAVAALLLLDGPQESGPQGPKRRKGRFDWPWFVATTRPYDFRTMFRMHKVDFDVLLSYARRDEVVSKVPRLDPHHDDYLGAAVESVDGIYQSALVPQLRRAFARRGMPEPPQSYPRATPQACARVDVHFAHPGVPDFAARAWLAMIATGL